MKETSLAELAQAEPLGDGAEPFVPSPEKRWYILIVDVGGEEKVKHWASKVGVPIYYPVAARARRVRRKKVIVRTPAFGRYVFAGIDKANPQYADLLAVPGARELIGDSLGPRPIDPAIIDRVIAAEQRGDFDEVARTRRAVTPRWVKPGRLARVRDGVLSTVAGGPPQGVIVRVIRSTEVEVDVTIFGKVRRVIVPLSKIERVE